MDDSEGAGGVLRQVDLNLGRHADHGALVLAEADRGDDVRETQHLLQVLDNRGGAPDVVLAVLPADAVEEPARGKLLLVGGAGEVKERGGLGVHG